VNEQTLTKEQIVLKKKRGRPRKYPNNIWI
jgi:hypothetical protein